MNMTRISSRLVWFTSVRGVCANEYFQHVVLSKLCVSLKRLRSRPMFPAVVDRGVCVAVRSSYQNNHFYFLAVYRKFEKTALDAYEMEKSELRTYPHRGEMGS